MTNDLTGIVVAHHDLTGIVDTDHDLPGIGVPNHDLPGIVVGVTVSLSLRIPPRSSEGANGMMRTKDTIVAF